jgi:hypothetical protein
VRLESHVARLTEENPETRQEKLANVGRPTLASSKALVVTGGKSSGEKALRGGFVLVLLALSGCFALGPSEERLGCLNGCAREKDQCMLEAMTAPAIQVCDAHGRGCSGACPE